MEKILTLIWMFTSLVCYAQNKTEKRLSKFDIVLQGDIESNEGSIVLNDGKELIGLVTFNDKTGILKFENGNTSKSFTARSVLGFEVYDPNFDGNRIFYSLQVEDESNGSLQPAFFELLSDFRTFAVLSRKAPLSAKQKKGFATHDYNWTTNRTTTTQWTRDKMVAVQVETFYLLKPQEDPKPYFALIVETADSKSLFGDGQKTKEEFVNKDLLKDYVGINFQKLEDYANEHDLSFKRKSDFLKIMEFYETLIN